VQRKTKLGIREIAKLAGVSTATVSRVINSPKLTSPETRAKVLDIINKYDYIPNQLARDFISGTSKSIGFMVLDLRLPFYISVIQHLNHLALENGYTLLICDTGTSFEIEKKYFQYCKSIRAAGVIFTAGRSEGWEQEIGICSESANDFDMPIVLLDRKISNNQNCYIVGSNDFQGITLLFDYLYNLGHRKIGFIRGPVFMSSANARYNSYLSNMAKHHLPHKPSYVYIGNFSEPSGMDAFDYFNLLDDPPTAIIAANDAMARGFILKAFSYNVEIPGKYSICGMDGIDESSFFPPLTTVRQNTRALAETMFNFIVHKDSIKPQQAILDVEFSQGRTCRKIDT
jgi:LacI family repressor for deo operon, udp, cdd, tsx, nupC, and nupG